jgi:serine/threonine protein phosphatase PrpC
LPNELKLIGKWFFLPSHSTAKLTYHRSEVFMVQIKFNAKTDIGNVRKVNQDSYLLNSHIGLFVVCDGMGGHAGGEIASSLCCSTIEKCILDAPIEEFQDDSKYHQILSTAINKASTEIYEEALRNPDLKGMGTTATSVLIQGLKLHCGHVGDSRFYLIRQGFMYLLSSDHSLIYEQIKAGVITEEEALSHRLRNIITRSVGFLEEEYVDCFSIDLEIGDYILLCSDGLTGKISNQEICGQIKTHDLQAVGYLIDLAKERGGEDNITAVLLKIFPDDPSLSAENLK